MTGRLQVKAVANQSPLGDVFYQRYHYRRTSKALAYALAQGEEVGVMIHHLAVVHGDVLTQILGFQLSMSLTVELTLLRYFAPIQLPKVMPDRLGDYFVNAGLLLQGGFCHASVQFWFNG
ncbi:MAG: hypothetical protein FJZ89_11060 [Chloroflexi bacterium]|nr:hypothetical protein [Chloroflexota bacterium]